MKSDSVDYYQGRALLSYVEIHTGVREQFYGRRVCLQQHQVIYLRPKVRIRHIKVRVCIITLELRFREAELGYANAFSTVSAVHKLHDSTPAGQQIVDI